MRDPLAVELERWTGEKLITADQARAILSAETTRSTDAVEGDRTATEHGEITATRRRAVLAEVVGSLGAIAAGVAAVVGTAVLWSQLTTVARLAIPAVGSVALLAAGAAVPRGESRSSERLGALLWLLAVGALAATTAILTSEIIELAPQNVVLLSGLVALIVSLVLLRRSPTAHLVIAVVGAAVATAVGVVLQYDSAQSEHVGSVLLCLGAAVILLGWSDILPERSTGIIAGAGVALVGAEMLGGVGEHWPIVAAGLVALGLLVMYVGSRDRAALVAGLVLAVVVVVQGIVQLAGETRGGPGGNRWVVLLVFTIGAGVLAASIVAIRSSTRSTSRSGRST